MRFYLRSILSAVVLAVLLPSCYPDMVSTVDELDIAITHYNQDKDFSPLNTFYLPDTVVYVGDDEEIRTISEHKHDAHILGEVRQNLLDLGWTEITDTSLVQDDADVSLFVSVLKTDFYSYINYWWDYWYWYPWDWWYYSSSSYYYWYPGYWGGFYDYSYTAGTVLIEMLDVNALEVKEDPDKTSVTVPILWTAGINGILGASEENINNRITTQIEAAFTQSPYLAK